MTTITWNHSCTVGVSAMDAQHGILMDAMNELRLAVLRGAGHEQSGALLNQLVEFTRMHFQSEEQLMEHYAYPGLDAHRAEHRRLLAQLLESANAVQRGEAIAMRGLFEFLRDWFIDHIAEFDSQYGPWLNEHGVF